MTRTRKVALAGFAFGTLGLFVLSALSLLSQTAELLSTPFVWPGRFLAETFIGPEGSDLDVALLTLANGLLYVGVFLAGDALWHKVRPESAATRRGLVIAAGIVMLAALVAAAVWARYGEPPAAAEPQLPVGYTLDDYRVAEVTDTACKRNDDCLLPMEYAVQSNCPYQSLCLTDRCTVVCPQYK